MNLLRSSSTLCSTRTKATCSVLKVTPLTRGTHRPRLPGNRRPYLSPLVPGTHRRRLAPAQSFLGVGAPEALLVGVVALVVFGPKGLADAAKSIGSTLRAFQPTIREVVEVSQDIKGTLEKELGLDEIREAARVPPRPVSPTSPTRSMDELVRERAAATGEQDEAASPAPAPPSLTSVASSLSAADEDPDIEAKRRASAAMAWGASSSSSSPAAGTPATAASSPASSSSSVPAAPAAQAGGSGQPTPAAAQQQQAPASNLGSLSMEELEAELARRRAAAAAGGASNNSSSGSGSA